MKGEERKEHSPTDGNGRKKDNEEREMKKGKRTKGYI